MVNDEGFDRAFAGDKLQAELFLKGRENGQYLAALVHGFVGRPFECYVRAACQACLVDYLPVNEI
jgi:hypothetical protein